MTTYSRDAIAKRAYELWEKEGRPEGRQTEHWIRAEQEIARTAPSAIRPQSPAPAKAKGPDSPAPRRVAIAEATRPARTTQRPGGSKGKR